ncbi:hypothetical protein AYI70_g10803 [Smittium culicis]|uniref:Carboxymuconolactone decarboxylase-like domain-containing protein n=1 Tax=Smittium culicis TaxID=133412 RepID=A0A1R1X4V2_9FUNG|nr:hypothetical protein AYI70_g10803 [Smittium culicis]
MLILLRILRGTKKAMTTSLDSFHPDLVYSIIECVYSDILSNDAILSDTESEIITVAAICILDTPEQLFSHVRGAKRLGVAETSIEAILELSREIKNII